MAEPSIAIVVTNYNTWELTTRCVQKCFDHDRGNFSAILVYDDCSTIRFDGVFPDTTRLHRGPANVGLTKALNIAVGLVTEDIVIIFDSDAYPTTAFCCDLKSMFDADPSLGLVGLRTIGRGGGATESYSSEPNVWSLLLGQALFAKTIRWFPDRSGRLSIFTCAMAVRRRAFLELNGFDDEFDWLDLDHDFSMRMHRSCWKVAIARGPRVFHEGGGTPQLTRERVLRFYKARWYLLRKFDRLPLRRTVKFLVVSRLIAEYIVLLTAGRLVFTDKTTRQDKILGRRALIRFCIREWE